MIKSLRQIWKDATLLSIVTTIVALYRTIFVVLMFAFDAIHLNRYTYWNYIGATAFYIILWIAYVSNNPRLFKALCVWFVPVVFGSVFFVCLYIIIILQLDNGQLFMAATYVNGGSLSPGTVHTADHIVHTFPLVDFLVVLVSGFVKEVRYFIKAFHSSLKTQGERLGFLAYFFVAPLVPFAFYCCFFNPFKEYPVEVSSFIPLSIGALTYLLVVWWVHSVMTTDYYGHFRKKDLVVTML